MPEDLSRGVWRKSTLSHQSGCVEVAVFASHVAVRNSADPDGPVLLFTPHEWQCFVGGVRDGEFEPPKEATVP
jgi:uncharacterized protein DUF397